MATRVQEPDTDLIRYRAQHRAVWEFAASVEGWRCRVCYARVEFEDRERFESTHLCTACSEAVNESLAGANDADF
jgi:hypothetical protein